MAELNYVSLDDMIADVKEKESQMKEPQEVSQSIRNTSYAILSRLESGKPIKILTDYDADGICSAYIMEHTLKAINPNVDVEVICNDRRGHYGVPKDIECEINTSYIIFDMGSNELDYIYNTFGSETIVVDHHLIEDEKNRNAFLNNINLLNPHAFNENDSLNAQYCATGLSYRLYEEIRTILEQEKDDKLADAKLYNTLTAVASIGTICDMVDVMDINSRNREIIKKGLEIINNADENNFDFVLGHTLTLCGIGEEDIYAKKIGYNVGAFLNSTSRMSEYLQENGATRMYRAITADENDSHTYLELAKLSEICTKRKELISELQNEEYNKVANTERHSEGNIFVYILPDNTPTAFAGLVAGRLSEATDKAVLCVSYSDKKGGYSGSGRNAKGNSGLKEFMDKTVGDMDINYGGHTDAIGISNISKDDIAEFCNRIENNRLNLTRDENTITVLNMTSEEAVSEATLNKLKELQPLGTGLTIPPIVVGGVETYKDARLKGNEHWKKLRFKGEKGVSVVDFNYDESNYPLNSKGEIVTLAELNINSFNGSESVEFSALPSRVFDKVAMDIKLTKGKVATLENTKSKGQKEITD